MRKDPKTSRPVLAKEHLALGPIDSCHIRVLGIISAKPDYPYPLARSLYITDRPVLHTASTYQESPVWDWAGELLARA